MRRRQRRLRSWWRHEQRSIVAISDCRTRRIRSFVCMTARKFQTQTCKRHELVTCRTALHMPSQHSNCGGLCQRTKEMLPQRKFQSKHVHTPRGKSLTCPLSLRTRNCCLTEKWSSSRSHDGVVGSFLNCFDISDAKTRW